MSTTITDFLPKITSLQSELASLTSVIATEANAEKLLHETRSVEYIVASLAYVSAQQVAATATASEAMASTSLAIESASSALSALTSRDNPYGMVPSYGGNLALTIVMAVFLVSHSSLGIFYRTWWFGISYFCGTGLEFAGYIGRFLSTSNYILSEDYFLLQIICLTIAPCFIMAGIYFLLAQMIMVYGPQFAPMKPMWYSYIFITCDIISLVIQGAGGGMAASDDTDSTTGTNVMVGGIAFQLVSMGVFLVLFIHYFWKIGYLRSGFSKMEPHFNPTYAYLRSRRLFKYFPLAVFVGVLFVYIRSIYRLVELAEGWAGYLITHETYFLVLDALMMCLTCVLFLFFHPGFVIGKGSIPVKERSSIREIENSDAETGSKVEFGQNSYAWT